MGRLLRGAGCVGGTARNAVRGASFFISFDQSSLHARAGCPALNRSSVHRPKAPGRQALAASCRMASAAHGPAYVCVGGPDVCVCRTARAGRSGGAQEGAESNPLQLNANETLVLLCAVIHAFGGPLKPCLLPVFLCCSRVTADARTPGLPWCPALSCCCNRTLAEHERKDAISNADGSSPFPRAHLAGRCAGHPAGASPTAFRGHCSACDLANHLARAAGRAAVPAGQCAMNAHHLPSASDESDQTRRQRWVTRNCTIR